VTCLYRHFDENDRLLYVGISVDALSRLIQHKRSAWWGEVATITIQRFATRDEALKAEAEAIRCERPKHNKALAPYKEAPRIVHEHQDESVGITVDDLVAYFGSQAKAAEAVGLKQPSVAEWKECGVPIPRQCQYELLTGGALKAFRRKAA
jgi:predicted GIY-YIG superfamily endonuclease